MFFVFKNKKYLLKTEKKKKSPKSFFFFYIILIKITSLKSNPFMHKNGLLHASLGPTLSPTPSTSHIRSRFEFGYYDFLVPRPCNLCPTQPNSPPQSYLYWPGININISNKATTVIGIGLGEDVVTFSLSQGFKRLLIVCV